MSVTLFEPALQALLQGPASPVMRDVIRRAEAAADALEGRMQQIIQDPFLTPQAEVAVFDDEVIVGILDQGRVSEYMGFKLEREDWWDAVGREAASE